MTKLIDATIYILPCNFYSPNIYEEINWNKNLNRTIVVAFIKMDLNENLNCTVVIVVFIKVVK